MTTTLQLARRALAPVRPLGGAVAAATGTALAIAVALVIALAVTAR